MEELVTRIRAVSETLGSYEIVLVDDRSPDDSWSAICRMSQKYSEVRGIRLSRNFGQHAAISAGLGNARGEFVVVMDCDLQDDPKHIPAMLESARGGADVVLTHRTVRAPLRLSQHGRPVLHKDRGVAVRQRRVDTRARKLLDAQPQSGRRLHAMLHDDQRALPGTRFVSGLCTAHARGRALGAIRRNERLHLPPARRSTPSTGSSRSRCGCSNVAVSIGLGLFVFSMLGADLRGDQLLRSRRTSRLHVDHGLDPADQRRRADVE